MYIHNVSGNNRHNLILTLKNNILKIYMVMKMKNLIVDYRISDEEEASLKSMNYNVLKCPECPQVLWPINGHPDMQVNILSNNTIVVHNQISDDFINLLSGLNYRVILSKNTLKNNYPYDIILNAVCTDSFILHNLKYTDESLLNSWKFNLKESSSEKASLINVKQGYTKCSTAVAGDNAFITSDNGIARALTSLGMDVLLLPPGDILLPGMNYGFIGGCCGLIGDNIMAFYGDLKQYAYGEQVINFLKLHNTEYIALSHGKLTDRGSILRLK